MKKINKKAAMELSISTIVIVVIAVTMLILGLVLVRSIMCGAIGLTLEINDKVKGEINRLFQTEGSEVVCIGSGGEPVTLIPGQLNIIYCAVNAPTKAEYKFEVDNIEGTGDLEERDIEDWIEGETDWKDEIAPGDKLPKKILRLKLPDNAPEESIVFTVKIEKDNELISTQDLDFSIRRVGSLRSAMC